MLFPPTFDFSLNYDEFKDTWHIPCVESFTCDTYSSWLQMPNTILCVTKNNKNFEFSSNILSEKCEKNLYSLMGNQINKDTFKYNTDKTIEKSFIYQYNDNFFYKINMKNLNNYISLKEIDLINSDITCSESLENVYLESISFIPNSELKYSANNRTLIGKSKIDFLFLEYLKFAKSHTTCNKVSLLWELCVYYGFPLPQFKSETNKSDNSFIISCVILNTKTYGYHKNELTAFASSAYNMYLELFNSLEE